MAKLIIHEAALNYEQTKAFERCCGKPQQFANHYRVNLEEEISPEKLEELREATGTDINLLPANFNPSDIKLIISDMDSTFISIETIDEIADHIGIKPQIAEITEAAMQGKLVFEDALIKRVNLLEGIPTSALDEVYKTRLKLNPGAEDLVKESQKQGIKFALVSGGFTHFTDKLQQDLSLDYAKSNVLEIKDNKLTGKVVGEIVGAQAKADYLYELCKELNIEPHQAIAVGDGANDLVMMQEAGLSVAYHAKPAVKEQAQTQLNVRGLDAILDFLAE